MLKSQLPSQSFFDSIDALILDLGGVLIDLNPKKTFDAFNSLLKVPIPNEDLHKKAWLNIIYQYERGEISSQDFRQSTLDFFKISEKQLPDHIFNEFWGALLVDFPSYRLDYLMRLKEKLNSQNKRLLLLSNINELHDIKSKSLLPDGKQDWGNYFDHTYLSYQMGCRKPDQVIYQKLVTNEGISPHRLFFVDDLKSNIEGAQKTGIKGAWLDLNREDFVLLCNKL